MPMTFLSSRRPRKTQSPLTKVRSIKTILPWQCQESRHFSRMAAGDADKPGSTGNRPDPAKFWHGFRSQARGPRPRKPGRHGSWATSHRETARDRHIHAARFTTIKMGAAEWRIVLSPACIEESIRFIGQQLRHRNGNHHVSKDDFDVETIILIRVISRLLGLSCCRSMEKGKKIMKGYLELFNVQLFSLSIV